MIELSVAGLVALVGLLMFVLASNPKLARIGEIMLFCGLLAGLLLGVHYLVK
jgi:ribose/xylose/arabinose/galactoside ABC-type transport system permease subunit